MINRTTLIALLAASVLGTTPATTIAQQAPEDDTSQPAPTGARVRFLDLKDGQDVPVGSVISFGLSGMGVAPAGVEKTDTGHHHLLVDDAAREKITLNEPIPSDDQHIHFGNGQTEWVVDLPPGRHQLKLVVGDAGHRPHNPAVTSKVIRINVVGRARMARQEDVEPVEQAVEVVRDCQECGEMIVVPLSKFRMGTKGIAAESPTRLITVKRPFAIAMYPVTFADWQACVDDSGCSYTPSDHNWGREDRPVIDVSWNDAKEYIRWLSEKTGQDYRLPTEVEWEYASRAGTSLPYYWGAEVEAGRANCKGCDETGQKQTMPVATYGANPWGLFDMAGNAAEWVEDCWHPSYQGAPADTTAWTKNGGGECDLHVLRGGSFNSSPLEVRSGSRGRYDTNVRYYTNGFRIARDVE